ncbi:immunoglobulin superfamily member 1-like [Macrotis lagotis]|uniref:immunoglobulin superfamily member 1-like n=1 Tax=Macrotis lagotis TaxID=92651 RepID=UPI003D68FA11
MDFLPRPTLWAVLGLVVLKGEGVTLRCQGQLGTDRFQLLMDGKFREEKKSSWGLAEFVLRRVDDQKDVRSYHCCCRKGSYWSELSDPLALVVMTSEECCPHPAKDTPSSASCAIFAICASSALATLWAMKGVVGQGSGTTAEGEEVGETGVVMTLSQAHSHGPTWPCDGSRDQHHSLVLKAQAVPWRGDFHSEEGQDPEALIAPDLNRSLDQLPPLICLMVELGTHVTLQCWLPFQSPFNDVAFSLLKVGTPQPLQSQSLGGISIDFPLFPLRAQDTGNYSCVFYERMTPHQLSNREADSLPKPSTSDWPSPKMASGANVSLLLWRPSWRHSFVLNQEGDEKILPSLETPQDGVQFFLTQVTPKHSVNYSCYYLSNSSGSLWTQPSDPEQDIVRGSMPNNTLIITLSHVSFVLLLLCLLLLAFLCQGSISNESITFLFQVPMAGDIQGVTYAGLDVNMLNKRKSERMMTLREPTYATVFRD